MKHKSMDSVLDQWLDPAAESPAESTLGTPENPYTVLPSQIRTLPHMPMQVHAQGYWRKVCKDAAGFYVVVCQAKKYIKIPT